VAFFRFERSLLFLAMMVSPNDEVTRRVWWRIHLSFERVHMRLVFDTLITSINSTKFDQTRQSLSSE
jgi:hypothetical protein